MDNIISEIESALRMRLYNIALQSTLTIPDICGALNSEDGQATGKKYKHWFNENVPMLCDDYLDGEVVYTLRCSLLHQGKFTHPKQKYDRIIFQPQNKDGIVIHKMIAKMNDENVLILNLNTFCEDILLSAKIWSFRNKDSENYKNNSTNLIQTNNDGYNNIVKGLPMTF